MERKVADFFTESLIQAFNDFLDHGVKVILFELLPGLFVAVNFVVQEVLFDELFDHKLFVVLSLLWHGIFDFAHLFNDFFFGVFPKAFDSFIKLEDRILTSGQFLSVEILTTLIEVITVVTVLHILVLIIVKLFIIIHFIKDL